MPFDGQNFYEQIAAEDEVLRVLTAALHRLTNPANWVKNYFKTSGAVCALGALEDASGGQWIGHDYLLDALPAGYPDLSVINFNDEPDTTHADVLALFDRAIATRRAEVAAKVRKE